MTRRRGERRSKEEGGNNDNKRGGKRTQGVRKIGEKEKGGRKTKREEGDSNPCLAVRKTVL